MSQQRSESRPAPPADVVHVENLIVGTGFAGLCAAIKLRESGHDDFLLLERADDVGGTWRDNSYPDCACDVPSYLYSFSFAPNPDWQHAFSRQPQILDYLRGVARDYQLRPRIRFGVTMTDAAWDEADGRWQVTSTGGRFTADRLILGMGGLSDPSIPDLPGLSRFTGKTFHSATWDHDHDLEGERVAVVGTGASAIQFIPHVQRAAAQLTVFQRTAPWVLPRRDRPYRRWERSLMRLLPGVQRAVRLRIYLLRELTLLGFVVRPSLMRFAEKGALKLLDQQVPDPELRRKLRPHFRLGCKRVLLSNDYYPALTRPNVEVVTDRIAEITSDAVVTEGQDGSRRKHPVETLIFGTGFRILDLPIAHQVRGRDGRTLAEHWAVGGMSAHRGLMVNGFPNLFVLVGPNTGLGHTSIVLMIEAQVGYLIDLIRRTTAAGARQVEPRREAQDAYNADLQAKLSGTVWNTGGCRSWYLDANGRNTTLWPRSTFEFMRQLRRADVSEYELRGAATRRDAVPA